MHAGFLIDAGSFRSTRDHDLKDDAIVVAQNELAIEVAPFISGWGTAQVVDTPVLDALAPVPVFVTHVLAFFPVVVPNVLVVVLLAAMILVVMVVLGVGGAACQR